ncbi:uncharacterized protein Dana_GF13102 [Drosophila ananassae]|uniref:Uncharacterized protein n=1 Tax=Drosophila ananassae TaxID=7217 RepID=B3MG30_DROAN|nr:uncharacterized protein LOC6495945 [Drosophila ananassae]EDV36725.2 uncharacterized protein Dana_GF13102 [Drosophila ananassae]
MIYLQRCCCFVDLRFGTLLVGFIHIVVDVLGGFFVAVFGESGMPDLGHRLFLIFMMIHCLSCVCLIIGCLKLRSIWMLPYVLLTLIKIMAMIILIIADVILSIWYPVIVLYVMMLVMCLYFWLVAYSFYAALGGALFI